jgi:hypothetical protein
MSYWDWGPPADRMTGSVLLVGDFDEGVAVPSVFAGCELVAEHHNPDVDNDEQGTDVIRCDGTRAPWSEIWPDLRRFY